MRISKEVKGSGSSVITGRKAYKEISSLYPSNLKDFGINNSKDLEELFKDGEIELKKEGITYKKALGGFKKWQFKN